MLNSNSSKPAIWDNPKLEDELWRIRQDIGGAEFGLEKIFENGTKLYLESTHKQSAPPQTHADNRVALGPNPIPLISMIPSQQFPPVYSQTLQSAHILSDIKSQVPVFGIENQQIEQGINRQINMPFDQRAHLVPAAHQIVDRPGKLPSPETNTNPMVSEKSQDLFSLLESYVEQYTSLSGLNIAQLAPLARGILPPDVAQAFYHPDNAVNNIQRFIQMEKEKVSSILIRYNST
jgi:hypothetical protein